MVNLDHPQAIRRRGPRGRVILLLLSGLSIQLTHAAPALAQSEPPARATAAHPYGAHIAEASRRFAIPESWIRAIMRVESANDLRAVSPKGAIGLMQVMPTTWAELRSRHRLGEDPFDPRDNVLAGAAYLREMLDRYGTVEGMLAAYNAGPARVDEYLLAGRILPAETRAYVAALAPPLGGIALPERAIANTQQPTDWREAPLFAVPTQSTATAADLHPTAPASEIPAASTSRDRSPDGQHTEALFVARSTGDRAP